MHPSLRKAHIAVEYVAEHTTYRQTLGILFSHKPFNPLIDVRCRQRLSSSVVVHVQAFTLIRQIPGTALIQQYSQIDLALAESQPLWRKPLWLELIFQILEDEPRLRILCQKASEIKRDFIFLRVFRKH